MFSLPDFASSHWVHSLCLDFFVCHCLVCACMLYYCNIGEMSCVEWDAKPCSANQSGYDMSLPYLTFGVGRLLHLPSAEAVSVRPNAQPRCNQKVTVIGCEAETSAVKPKSAVKPNKSPATWDW